MADRYVGLRWLVSPVAVGWGSLISVNHAVIAQVGTLLLPILLIM